MSYFERFKGSINNLDKDLAERSLSDRAAVLESARLAEIAEVARRERATKIVSEALLSSNAIPLFRRIKNEFLNGKGLPSSSTIYKPSEYTRTTTPGEYGGDWTYYWTRPSMNASVLLDSKVNPNFTMEFRLDWEEVLDELDSRDRVTFGLNAIYYPGKRSYGRHPGASLTLAKHAFTLAEEGSTRIDGGWRVRSDGLISTADLPAFLEERACQATYTAICESKIAR